MSGIELRAMLELALAGGFCGALGFWVVSERLTYAGESLAHGLLPGLVLAGLAGAPLLLGAAGGAIAAALLIGLAARDPRVGPDAGTAVKHVGQSRTGFSSGLGAATFLGAAALRGVAAREARGAAAWRGAALRVGVKWAVRSAVPPSPGRPAACQCW